VTHLEYSISEKGYILKRIKYADSAGLVSEQSCPTLFYASGSDIDRPLRRNDGPYQLELGFRLVKDLGFAPGPTVLPQPGEVEPLSYQVEAFGATFRCLGIYGKGAHVPGQVRAIDEPSMVFSLSGDSRVIFTLCTGRLQPYPAENQVDLMGRQTVAFPCSQAAYGCLYALGPEACFHFHINTPAGIGPPLFRSYN
jgi:hypothetical protein